MVVVVDMIMAEQLVISVVIYYSSYLSGTYYRLYYVTTLDVKLE